jgi:hypothetical protein
MNKRILVPVTLSLGLLSALGFVLTFTRAPTPALAQSPDNTPVGVGNYTPLADLKPAAPQAAVTRLTDMRVMDYRPVMTVAYHITDTLVGSLPNPLNWYLDNFDPNRLSHLTCTWAGGGSCSIQSNNDIKCTGTLTRFEAAYSFYYTPTLYGANLYLGWSGATSFATDYTITVSYPDPLVYVSSPVSPPVQSGHRLIWHQANTQELDGYGFFHDPRVQVIDLPVILK